MLGTTEPTSITTSRLKPTDGASPKNTVTSSPRSRTSAHQAKNSWHPSAGGRSGCGKSSFLRLILASSPTTQNQCETWSKTRDCTAASSQTRPATPLRDCSSPKGSETLTGPLVLPSLSETRDLRRNASCLIPANQAQTQRGRKRRQNFSARTV